MASAFRCWVLSTDPGTKDMLSKHKMNEIYIEEND